jgi:uncharacterized heparinase superfamily protein
VQGRFQFLNIERELCDPVDWHLGRSPELPRLWRFHLHYHEFLVDLASEGLRSQEPGWFQRAWSLVDQWISASPLQDAGRLADAWHPYTISRRLPAWMLLWTASPPSASLQNRVLQSMFTQAAFLERHLEWDLGGNHLLENLKALILAGAFFRGVDADRWLRKGAGRFARQLLKQILPHGEHFERSPMYHAQALEAVLDLRDATASVSGQLSKECCFTAERMAGFLAQILHPNQEPPAFGDSCFGETSAPAALVARASAAVHESNVVGTDRRPVASGDARLGGTYWTWRDGDDFLVFDAGPVGPDHLPAHAHADLLTFEASVGGRRLFVDSGVFGYEDDAMRRYCRNTAAHNVLQVDDTDQCDMWSRFRMGYRGWPTELAVGETNGFYWARARHDAYRRLNVPEVGRWFACRPGGPWFCVDWAFGRGIHLLVNRLHLHPDVHAEQIAVDEVSLRCGGVTVPVRFLGRGELALTSGWYCPEFGRRLSSTVLEWRWIATLPTVAAWSLLWAGCNGQVVLDAEDASCPQLWWSQGADEIEFCPRGCLRIPVRRRQH